MSGSKLKKITVPLHNSNSINLPASTTDPISSKINTNLRIHKVRGKLKLTGKAEILEYLHKCIDPSTDIGKDENFKKVSSKREQKVVIVNKPSYKSPMNPELSKVSKSTQNLRILKNVQLSPDLDKPNSSVLKVPSSSNNYSSVVSGNRVKSINFSHQLSNPPVSDLIAMNLTENSSPFTHGVVTGFTDDLTNGQLKYELSLLLSSLNCNQSADDILKGERWKVRVGTDKSFGIIFSLRQQNIPLRRYSLLKGNIKKVKMCTFRQEYYVTYLTTEDKQLLMGSHDNVGMIQGIQGDYSEFNTKASKVTKWIKSGCHGSNALLIPCPLLIRSGFSSLICAEDNSKRGKSNSSCYTVCICSKGTGSAVSNRCRIDSSNRYSSPAHHSINSFNITIWPSMRSFRSSDTQVHSSLSASTSFWVISGLSNDINSDIIQSILSNGGFFNDDDMAIFTSPYKSTINYWVSLSTFRPPPNADLFQRYQSSAHSVKILSRNYSPGSLHFKAIADNISAGISCGASRCTSFPASSDSFSNSDIRKPCPNISADALDKSSSLINRLMSRIDELEARVLLTENLNGVRDRMVDSNQARLAMTIGKLETRVDAYESSLKLCQDKLVDVATVISTLKQIIDDHASTLAVLSSKQAHYMDTIDARLSYIMSAMVALLASAHLIADQQPQQLSYTSPSPMNIHTASSASPLPSPQPDNSSQQLNSVTPSVISINPPIITSSSHISTPMVQPFSSVELHNMSAEFTIHAINDPTTSSTMADLANTTVQHEIPQFRHGYTFDYYQVGEVSGRLAGCADSSLTGVTVPPLPPENEQRS